MNGNLCGMPEGIVKTVSNLYLAREMDRLVDSVVRPNNVSSGTFQSITNSAVQPINAFLTPTDSTFSPSTTYNYTPHGNGWTMLFADAHVKLISAAVFTAPIYYDGPSLTNTLQWYSGDQTGGSYNNTIAITP